MRESWDEYFMGMAAYVGKRSKDRSTQVGAVIVGPDREVRSVGFNGFARGVDDNVEDRHERPRKYLYMAHSEENAVANAARAGICTKGCTLYVYTHGNRIPPCSTCARIIIQAGIVRVVYLAGEVMERWKEQCEAAMEMFKEAGVEAVGINKKDGDK